MPQYTRKTYAWASLDHISPCLISSVAVWLLNVLRYKIKKRVITSCEAVILVYQLFYFWRMLSSGMWRCVGLVLTDVSEEHIASILSVAKFASEALALAGGCRLSPSGNNQHCKNWTEWEGNVGHMGNQQLGWGGSVCWVCVEGQRQVAVNCPETAVCRSGVGKIQGYWASNIPVASGLDGERVLAFVVL
jgi:hypothetical protein